jgi:2,4-dienoyl-CoA reductase (NADPH2)
LINTGIGWHEARVPTIATMVPRAAFAWVTRKMKGEVKIPLIATNRINDPAAPRICLRGDADMVSMARPFLADADFVAKAAAGRADEINTCIACNQACLDQIFERKVASCLVNPRACHETEIVIKRAAQPKRVAVVGAGPAGLACATTAAEAGHAVTLFDAADEIGGQFNLAKRIPGKAEFSPNQVEYVWRRIEISDIGAARPACRCDGPRRLRPRRARDRHRPSHAGDSGIDHPGRGYVDIVHGRRGHRVAIIALWHRIRRRRALTHGGGDDTEVYPQEWGIDSTTRTAAVLRRRRSRDVAEGMDPATQGGEGR